MNENKNIMLEYDNSIHRLGKISSAIMILALASVPIVMQIVFKYKLDWSKMITATLAVLSYYGVVSCVEFVSFAPVLGAGGTYLSFITGNISNLKLPAAIASMKIAGLEPGTKEAEVVSLISIAVSTFVTTGTLFLGMLLFSLILPVLQSPTLAPAFTNLMPAMLGALAIPYLLSNLKTSSVPMGIATALTLTIGYMAVSSLQSFLMPIFLIIAVLWRYFLYRIDQKKEKNKLEKTY